MFHSSKLARRLREPSSISCVILRQLISYLIFYISLAWNPGIRPYELFGYVPAEGSLCRIGAVY